MNYEDSKILNISIILASLILIYLLYIFTSISSYFFKTESTKIFTHFAEDLIHRYSYSILIVLFAICLSPTFWCCIFSCLICISIYICMLGYMQKNSAIVIISNLLMLSFSIGNFISIIIYIKL